MSSLRYPIKFVLLTLLSCVESFDFNTAPPEELMVVEGLISTDEGPYTVIVSRGLQLDQANDEKLPFENLTITLFDDVANSELFIEQEPGIYLTQGIIRGQVGRSYHIRIETPDGNLFESEPDYLNPVGTIEDIRFEFEARTVEGEFTEERADVFNVYFDANSAGSESLNNYTRWRYTGLYEVMTNPELNTIILQGNGLGVVYFPDPLPCSGYVQVDIGTISTIQQVDECTCCTCWVFDYEEAPYVNADLFVENGEFRNIKIAEIPINTETFHDRYQVQLEQMSLSQRAYDFFSVLGDQELSSDDLFQPIPAEVVGNIEAVNNSADVIGLFWATSIRDTVIYLDRTDVPYPLTTINPSTRRCQDVYENSTNIQPEEWDD